MMKGWSFAFLVGIYICALVIMFCVIRITFMIGG